MTADSEDEYAMYDDYSNFTEEELAQIDSFVARDQTCTTTTVPNNNNPTESPGIPHIQIELEDTAPATESLASPLQLFRSTKTLSVTDISSPAWCEVQFDYGLRQMRHRKLKDRPASFVTEKGKEIFVDSEAAASSDKVKRKGVSVHKKLEREIRPEEIKVSVSTEEERWGLRLINMIDCIDSLLLLGCAREIPVFGLVQGHVVVGIIDEIIFEASSSPHNNKKRGFQSSPSSPQKPKRIRRSPSPSQSKITSFMSFDEKSTTTETSPSSSDAPTSCTTPSLHLIDTKTRRSNSLPQDEDTFPSRIQLMLYYRMLTDLMSTSNALDLPFFWKKLSLDATAPFSRKFIAQTLLTEETNCLHDLVRFWRIAVSRLNGAKIDSTLQLVYRLQSRFSGHRRNKNRNESGESASGVSSREELEIARAIQASLRDVQVVHQDEHRLAEALARRVTDPGVGIEEEKSLVEDPELLWAIEQSLLIHLDQNGQSSSENNQSSIVSPPMEEQRTETPQHSDPDIIGTKEFEFDDQVLDDYLTDIMNWWNGARPSRGVSLKQSGRCFSCEYRIGCEWRDQKASEIESEVRDRRKQLTG